MDAHPKTVDRMADVMRREIDHPGLSVIVTVRECIETARARKQTDATGTLETKRRQDTEGTMSEVGC
jgi:TPP-dependent indolepyruvate ferredoxin oxidoreductase alpha subunit